MGYISIDVIRSYQYNSSYWNVLLVDYIVQVNDTIGKGLGMWHISFTKHTLAFSFPDPFHLKQLYILAFSSLHLEYQP